MWTKNNSLSIKAQSSIGLLLIFISSLFVAAIAAGVFIQSNQGLQEKALATGKETRDDVASRFFIIDMVGTNGIDGEIDFVQLSMKLPPGMPAVKMDYVMLSWSTENVTSSLKYRGVGSAVELGNDGYNTARPEDVGELGDQHDLVNPILDGPAGEINLNIDVDLDGAVDTIAVCQQFWTCPAMYSGSYMQLNLSTEGIIYVPIYNDQGVLINLAIKDNEEFGSLMTPIGTVGYMTITGNENDLGGGFRIAIDHVNIYRAPATLAEDIDDDGVDDTMAINDTHIFLYLSSKGNVSLQQNLTEGISFPLGVDLSAGGITIDTNITLIDPDTSTNYGDLSIFGTTSRASYIDASVKVKLTPETLYDGYYSIYYVQKSPDYQDGTIRTGDVVRMHYETPRPIGEDERIHLTIIPKTGTPTQAIFSMPNIIAKDHVRLYP